MLRGKPSTPNTMATKRKTKKTSPARKLVRRRKIFPLGSQLYFKTVRYWSLEKYQLFAVRGMFYRVRSPFHALTIDGRVKIMFPWTMVDTYFSGPQQNIAPSLSALSKFNSGVE